MKLSCYNIQRHSIQLCVSNFVVTDWGSPHMGVKVTNLCPYVVEYQYDINTKKNNRNIRCSTIRMYIRVGEQYRSVVQYIRGLVLCRNTNE